MTFQCRLDALTTELWGTRGERGHTTRFKCDTFQIGQLKLEKKLVWKMGSVPDPSLQDALGNLFHFPSTTNAFT